MARETLFFLLVVIRIAGIEPVTLRVHIQPQDLRIIRAFQQNLLLGYKRADDLCFDPIEMKYSAVSLLVHVGICEEKLGWAALGYRSEHLRAQQIFTRLSCEDHRPIALPPSLERFQYVIPD